MSTTEPEPIEGHSSEQTPFILPESKPLQTSSQSNHSHDADKPDEADEPSVATDGPTPVIEWLGSVMEPQQEDRVEEMQGRTLEEQTEIPLLEPQARVTEPQVTVREPQTKKTHHSPPPVMWNPFWLRKGVLMGLLSLFTALPVALGLLCYFSNTHNGISTRLSDNSYSWTYGPPAVFIAISSIWVQVDFWSRILVPWQEMKHNFSPAEKSLLVDYVSCNPVVATWKAWKNGHWVVISTSIGVGLLHLLIIFSTALLVLEPTAIVDDDFSMIHTTRFARELNLSSLPPQDIAAESRFVAAYAGILNKGLQHPNGTFANLAYESVEPVQAVSNNTTVIASTVAFLPELNCEVAKVDPILTAATAADTAVNPHRNVLNVTFTDSICSFTYSGWKYRLCDPEGESCPDRDVLAWWEAYVYRRKSLECNDGPDNTRMIFAVLDVRYQQKSLKRATSNDESDQQGLTTIKTITGIVCRPRYTLRNSLIRFEGSLAEPGAIRNVTEVRNENRSSRIIHGFSNFNLTQAVYNSLIFSPGILQDSLPYDPNSLDKEAMYRLMRSVNGKSDLKAFLDPQVLITSAEAVFQGLSSQIAREYLLTSSNDSSLGHVQYIEDRLHPVPISVWLVGAGTVLLIGIGLVILLLRPYDVVPCDTTSIGAIATIVASSNGLNTVLNPKIYARCRSLQEYFAGCKFRTIATIAEDRGPSFRIESNLDSTISSPSATSPSPLLPAWWRPMAIRIPFLAVAVLLPTAFIISLEVLQSISNRNNGIIDIESGPNAQALASIIPAGLMVLAAYMVNSIHFHLRIFAPFKILKNSNALAHQSILPHHLGAGTLSTTLNAIQGRQPAVLFSATASTLAAVLSMVVSGLYFRDSATTYAGVTVQRLDWFDLNWNSSVANNPAAATFNLMQHYNLTYSEGTYQELAFPSLRLPPENLTFFSTPVTGQPIVARLPALRAALDCSAVPSQNITVHADTPAIPNCPEDAGGVFPGTRLAADIALSDQCRSAYPGNFSYATLVASFCFMDRSDGSQWTPMGQIQDLRLDTSYEPPFFENLDDTSDSPEGCPSLAFIFGSYKMGETSPLNTTVLVCKQLIQEVATDTTLLAPGLRIDGSAPPKPDESTAKPLDNGTKGAITRSYFLQPSFLFEFSDFPNETSSIYVQVDHFFQSVIHGPDGIPLSELIGSQNVERAKDAIQHVYRVYMAQAINSAMRRTIHITDSESDPFSTKRLLDGGLPTFAATAPMKRSRLRQSSEDKLILQILLGAIVLLIAAALVLAGDSRKVLVHNPCSIGGVVVLLVGSEMVERKVVPEGSEWMGQGLLERKGLFEGWLFSLGLWEERSGEAKNGNGNGNEGHERAEGDREGDGSGDVEEGERVSKEDGKERKDKEVRKRFGIDVGRAEVAS